MLLPNTNPIVTDNPLPITIIIPTLSNTKGLTYLVNFLKKHNLFTIIVDNAPNPQKQKLSHYDFITYLPQTRNLGFAKAINLASRYVAAPWMIILNDDIQFPDDQTFSKLLAIARSHKLTALSPLLRKPTGALENLGYFIAKKGRVVLNFDFQATNLDGITAACLLIKTNVFRRLNGFDERFFAYLEDVDFFLRLKKQGYSFTFTSDIQVIHNHMTTSSKLGNFKQKMDLRNWIFLICQNWSIQDKIVYFPSIFLERFRNLSGYLKATWRLRKLKSIFIILQDLLVIIFDLLIFPFKKPSHLSLPIYK